MTKEEVEEQELLRQVQRGNVLAMKKFYAIHSGYLTTVCSRYISDKDDIKDVLQDSFIKIFKAINGFEYRGLGSMRAWSTCIVVNESLKFLKSKERSDLFYRPLEDLTDMVEDEEPDFEEIPSSAILEMIRSLPIGYRTVFNLYVFEEKSHREIASILKITENTSASQLHRAKKFLVKQVKIYKSIINRSNEQ